MTGWRQLSGMLLALVACESTPTPPTPVSAPASVSTAPSAVVADPAAGRLLVDKYECHRCHDGTGLPAVAADKSCVTCHQTIIAGTFDAPDAALRDWRANITHLRHVPSLDSLGVVLRADWIATYLREPHDLRPSLPATMPRLDLSATDAQHIAAYLTRGAPADGPIASAGDVREGRSLFAAKQCGRCHAFSGASAQGVDAHEGDPRRLEPAVLLAPDLRHSRARLRNDAMVAWLRDPAALRPHALMPKTPLSVEEAQHLVAFITRAPLAPTPAPVAPARLPILERRVTYEEVSRSVFKKICWHCHAQPDFARGDGGPGMSGGFGFGARRLDLSSYESIAGGYLDDDGKMASSFRNDAEGVPMLVAVMLARQAEEAGRTLTVRGMPLGLPSMSPEQIQLVESWIAQGRPQ